MDWLSLIAGIGSAVIVFVIGFIVKDVFWDKSRKNQERIDNAVIESVKQHEKDIAELRMSILSLANTVGNNTSDINELKDTQKEINSVTRDLNSNIRLLIQNQESTNKVVIDNTRVMQENTKAINQFLNFVEKK